ncbi:MAG: amino acid ABC transporter permease [Halobacteriales archaeon]
MSAPSPIGRSGTRAVDAVPHGKLAVLGAVFWGWLVVRWVYDKVVNPGVVTRHREPFLPAWPFEAAADELAAVAGELGLAGRPLTWLAWVADVAALATASMPRLAEGAWLTLILTVAALSLGVVIAVPLAVARVYGNRPVRWLALSYTELIRGTPLLAQLFLLWFGLNLGQYVRPLPGVGETLPNDAAIVAIVGLTINSSAYQSEYIRSALTAVDPGQLTAARAIGMTELEGVRHVVLPQGLRFAIPGWTNEFIYLIKYSSLAAFIAVPELFRQARNIGSETFAFTEIYVVLAVFYLALVLTSAALMSRIEAWTAIPGLSASGE